MKQDEKKKKPSENAKSQSRPAPAVPAERHVKVREPEKKKKESKPQSGSSRGAVIAGIIAIAIIAIAAFFISMPGSNANSAKFSTFKSNFNTAEKVSIIVYYHNSSTYGQETVCSTYLVEVLASHRSPGSINYYTIDNNTCTYIPNGIGHAANVITNSTAFCLSRAASQPSISLNYGAANATGITPYRLNITGNMEYFKACPIAVDIS